MLPVYVISNATPIILTIKNINSRSIEIAYSQDSKYWGKVQ